MFLDWATRSFTAEIFVNDFVEGRPSNCGEGKAQSPQYILRKVLSIVCSFSHANSSLYELIFVHISMRIDIIRLQDKSL